MRVIGFDPSTKGATWTVIEVEGPKSRRWIDTGFAADEVEIAAAIRRQLPATLVAVEAPMGGAFGKRAKAKVSALLATSRTAGNIEGIATSLGYRTHVMSAQDWRRAVVGRVNPSDGMVKGALAALMQRMPRRSNSHNRDAAGVALAIAFRCGVLRAPRARLDADGTALGKTILTSTIRVGRECTVTSRPATMHIDTETGKRTPLLEAT